MFGYLLCIVVEMAAIFAVYWKGKLGVPKKENEKEQRFAVSPPSPRIRKNSALWAVSWAAFAFGSAFIQSSFSGHGNVPTALGIAMAVAGIAVYAWSYRWHIVVGDDYLIAYRLFSGETVARLTDIQRTGDADGKIRLGGNSGTIAVIDEKCGNYDRFREKLGGISVSVRSGA